MILPFWLTLTSLYGTFSSKKGAGKGEGERGRVRSVGSVSGKRGGKVWWGWGRGEWRRSIRREVGCRKGSGVGEGVHGGWGDRGGMVVEFFPDQPSKHREGTGPQTVSPLYWCLGSSSAAVVVDFVLAVVTLLLF